MAKNLNKRRKKRTDKGKVKARNNAKIQAQVNKRNTPSIVQENGSKMIVEKPSDVAPIPTDKNGNSYLTSDSAKLGSNKPPKEKLASDDEDTPTASYKDVASNLAGNSITVKPLTTSFHIVKSILSSSKNEVNIADDATIEMGSSLRRIRLSMMVAIPSADKGVEEDEAVDEVIIRMNNMLKSLINKIPSIKIGLWNPEDENKPKFLTELPKDVDIVEKYVFDFNRFISPGGRMYCRINIFYNDSKTSISEIEGVISGFKKPRVQFLQLAHSDSPAPIQMGSITGSVKAMATSPDFIQTFKKMFKLKYVGFWWTQPKSELSWAFTPKQFSVHYEIDRSDLEKNENIKSFFNKNISSVDNNFFGTPMSISPIFTPFLDDEVKMRITRHARKQLMIGSNIKSITITGIQILNWADKHKEYTLHRELMQVESINEKKVINSNGTSNFKGRLFYAIVPNQKRKSVEFYFSKANAEEARSVANALPLFIRDYFKLEPSFFCSSDCLAEALAGDWDPVKRVFLTLEEKEEIEKFSEIERTITASNDVFISESHQRALATDGDDINSVTTRLTKGDDAPPAAKSDDLSTLTGETRESKAKAYAAAESKKIASQYISTIDGMKDQHKQEMDEIRAQLALLQSKDAESIASAFTPVPRTNDMSGLSESSDSDEPIIVGVRRQRLVKKSRSPFRKNSNSKAAYDFNDGDTDANKKQRHSTVTPSRTSRYPSRFIESPATSSCGGQSL